MLQMHETSLDVEVKDWPASLLVIKYLFHKTICRQGKEVQTFFNVFLPVFKSSTDIVHGMREKFLANYVPTIKLTFTIAMMFCLRTEEKREVATRR